MFIDSVIGYMGSTWANFACYAVMMVISYFLGQKHYPIKYDLKRIFYYMTLSVLLYFVSVYTTKFFFADSMPQRLAFNTVLLITFIVFVVFSEPKLKSVFVKNK